MWYKCVELINPEVLCLDQLKMSQKVIKLRMCILSILGSSSAIYRCSEEDISYQLVTGYIYQNQQSILHTKVIHKKQH